MRLFIHATLAALLICASSAAGYMLKSKVVIAQRDGEPDYANLIPNQFGDWKLVPSIRLVTPLGSDELSKLIYSQQVGRGYVDSSGNLVMFLVAYGPRQTDRLQLHRPEICYVAEGFRLAENGQGVLTLADRTSTLEFRRLVARRENRTERITFWMRIGDDIALTQRGQQFAKLKYGLKGYVADGALIRISSINNPDDATADRIHARFLTDLFAAVPKEKLRDFIGVKS